MSRNFLQSHEFREQVSKDLERDAERTLPASVQTHQPEDPMRAQCPNIRDQEACAKLCALCSPGPCAYVMEAV